MFVKAGASNVQTTIRILDSTSGLPATGLHAGTAGLQLWYRRDSGTSTIITHASMNSAAAAYSSGGFAEIGRGYYRVDVPDAAFADGINRVLIAGGATGYMVVGREYQLIEANPRELISRGRTEVKDALSAIGLDHLLASQVANVGDVTRGSIFGVLAASSGEWNQYAASAHSQQAIRLRGDTNWTGLTAAAVRQQAGEALSSIQLHKLFNTSATLTDAVTGAFWAQMLTSGGDVSTFHKEQYSLQALRERGDAAWKTATNADIRQQVGDGLSSIGLDHLVGVSATENDIADGSVFAQIGASTGDWSSFHKNQHSLQVLAGAAGLTTSQVRQQVDEALSAIHLDHLLAVSGVAATVATGAYLAQLATSTGTFSSFNKEDHSLQVVSESAGLTTSQVRQQVDEALSAINLDHLLAASAISTDIATGTVFGQLAATDGNWGTYVKGTDSLQAIRDVEPHGTAMRGTDNVDSVPLSAIRSEMNVSLSAIGLDHLLSSAVNLGDVASNSVFAYLAASTTPAIWSEYNNTTDSLEAIRDRGDSAWITATGFSTHSAADVWSVGTREITGGSLSGAKKTLNDLNDISATQVRNETSAALADYDPPTHTELVSEINDVQTDISNLNDLSVSQVRIQVSEGLSAIGLDHLVSLSAAQTDVVDGSIFGQLAGSSGDWGTFQSSTDSLEALRNRGDSAWVTAVGFSTHSAADVWSVANRIITGGSLSGTKKTLDDLNDVSLVGVRTQAGDALSSIGLDHLLSVSMIDTDIVDGALFSQLATSTADWSSFNKEDHSLQVLSESAGLTTSQVRIQVDEALSAIGLDHLLSASAGVADVAVGTIIAQLATSTGVYANYLKESHSLEAIAGTTGLNTSQVRQQVDEALSAIHLDHLFSASATDNDIATGSFWTQAATSSGDWSDFDKTSHSLEVIAGAAGLTTSQVRQQVDEGLSAIHLDHLMAVSSISTNVATGALFAQLATSTGAFSSFNKEDHSLQTIAGAAGLTTSQVRQQVDEGLSAIGLDHLFAVSGVDTDIANGAFFTQIGTSTGDWSSFSKEDHSLQVVSESAGLTTSQVRQQVDEALSAINLDHLLALSATDSDIATGSFWAQVATSSGDWSDFDGDSHSLEIISSGAGLTTSQVRQQVDEALSAINLDHLLAVSAVSTDVATGTVIGQIAASTGNWANYVKDTESLESIRNRGDSAWTTAVGFSTHSAADIWSVANRTITGGSLTGTKKTFDDLNDLSAAQVRAEASGALNTYDPPTHTELTAEIDSVQTDIAALNDISVSQVRIQVSEGLSAIGLDHLLSSAVNFNDVASNSVFAYLASSTTPAVWSEFRNTTDSLQAIRDRGDSAWITAVGFSTHNAADIWSVANRQITGGSLSGTKKTFDDLNDLSTSQVRSQITEGLSAIGLDHLVSSAVNIGDVVTNSIFGKLAASSGEWSQFSASAHSLQAIRLRGDNSWTTAVGFSTHAASDIWAHPNRIITGGSLTGTKKTFDDLNDVSLAGVRTQVGDGLSVIGLDHLVSLSATQSDIVDGSVFGQLAGSSGDWGTFQSGTDSLEAIRNKQSDIEADTQDIQSRLPAALINGRMDSDMQAIAGDTTAASIFADSVKTILRGTAIAGSLTTTQMTTDITEATNEHFNGRVILWTTGNLQDQATDIVDYLGASGMFTYTAITEAPGAGDKFVVI